VKAEDEDLVDDLIEAASRNNEYDNREALHRCRAAVLRRIAALEADCAHLQECLNRGPG